MATTTITIAAATTEIATITAITAAISITTTTNINVNKNNSNNNNVMSYRRHDFFLRLHVSTMVGVCETRAEPSDNGLTELKRGTGQAPQKLINANQPGKNNNLNKGPKRDKIAKDIINAPKSRNSKNLSFIIRD